MWPVPVPEGPGCECCCAVGFESIGWRTHNSTPIFVSGNSLQVCPTALAETSIYASGRGVFALPEGAGCGPNFCQKLPDVTSCFCRRLPEVAKIFAGD